MLEALPIGVIVFPGSGIVENLADKARKMGIQVWRSLLRRVLERPASPKSALTLSELNLSHSQALTAVQSEEKTKRIKMIYALNRWRIF
jgi:hypothetical protein